MELPVPDMATAHLTWRAFSSPLDPSHAAWTRDRLELREDKDLVVFKRFIYLTCIEDNYKDILASWVCLNSPKSPIRMHQWALQSVQCATPSVQTSNRYLLYINNTEYADCHKVPVAQMLKFKIMILICTLSCEEQVCKPKHLTPAEGNRSVGSCRPDLKVLRARG